MAELHASIPGRDDKRQCARHHRHRWQSCYRFHES
ncbi:hypothetical protein ACP70R_013732 [Stipagrostis hirtigluma subsp. patula]